jgi:hypothetical protein
VRYLLQELSEFIREGLFGNIKMTGSISQSLLPYLAEKTSFIERFVDKDARCAYIPEDTSIDLVKDPHIAVKGSLILAEKELENISK